MGAFLLVYCGNRRSVRPLFLFRCILSAPAPADGRTDLVGGGAGLLCLPPRTTVSGEGHSGQWGFTWDTRGTPLPLEGWAWARLGYFCPPKEI